MFIKTNLRDQEIILFKPSKFMNESGHSVKQLIQFYKLKTEDICVIHDDLDIEPGNLQLKFGGGHAGHNGLRDIIKCCGSSDFTRIRIGIGHPGDTKKVNSFVVKKGSSSERKNKLIAMHNALEVFELVAFDDWEKALTQLHSKK